MNKFLLLLVTCMVSLAVAGRITTVNPDRGTGLGRLSQEDLLRQKFILDIVERVQQPLQQDELIQLDQGLIVNPQRYFGGIDGEMQRVIALDRQRRLLDEHQTYSVAQVEHVQQLRGIYRLLVRSDSFDTFRRNVVYLRRNINPVLLVNALALALRERQDTQNLIMPAIRELLPELYLDQDVIERVQQNVSRRPTLMDVVGIQRFNPIMGFLMPWRELHLQMALKRQQARLAAGGVGGQERVVIPIENQDISGISLFTEDIALRSFIQNLIQELALREDRESLEQELGLVDGTLLRVNRRRQQEQEEEDDQGQDQDQDQDQGQYRYQYQDQQRTYGNDRERFLRVLLRNNNDNDNDDVVRSGLVRVPLQRDNYMSYHRQGGVQDLPTVNVDSQRLLHVSRRRLNSIEQEREQQEKQQEQDRQQQFGRRGYIGGMRGDRFSEGRRVQQDERQDDYDIYNRYGGNNNKNYNKDIYGGRQRTYNDNDFNGYQTQGQRYRPNGDQGRDYNEYQYQRNVKNYQDQRDQQRGYQYDSENDYFQRPIDRLESVERDDERLVHINRRRLGEDQYQDQYQQQQQQQRQRQQSQQRNVPRRGNTIDEGRRVVDGGVIQDEDIVKFIRMDNRLKDLSDEEILQMLQRNRQQRRQQRLNNNDDDDDDDDDNDDEDNNNNNNNNNNGEVQQGGGRRNRRSLVQIQNSRRNEILLHTLRQLVARLNQERIALGQQQRDQQYIYNPRQTQTERYANRLNDMRLDSRRSRDLLEQINDIERRLATVIGQEVGAGRGEYVDQHTVERRIADVLLGRVGQVGIVNIVRQLIQDNTEQGNRLTLSDPVVQHTLRRIVNIVDEQREQLLGSYRRDELNMPGVTINDARIDKLRTRYEENDMDLSNLVGQQQQQQQRTIVGRQRRLNNKPFTIDLDISSDRPQEAIVRMFLGPREDQQGREVTLEQRRRDFVLLDAINVQLQSGRNRIQRRSIDIPWTSRDVTPYTEIYRRVMLQLRGQQEFDNNQELVGENGRFPQRLLLPRGRTDGLPMQLFVIVSPLQVDERVERRINDVVMGIGSSSVQDIRPFGYPLDRRIDNEDQLIQLSNINLQDVVIIQEN